MLYRTPTTITLRVLTSFIRARTLTPVSFFKARESLDLQFVAPFTATMMNEEILARSRQSGPLSSGPTFYVKVRTWSNNVHHAVNQVVNER
jgi:hypothetical protein